MASEGTREPPDKTGGGGDAPVATRKRSKLRSCCFWVCAPAAVLLAALGVGMYLDYRRWERREVGMMSLGPEGASLFLAYDSNEDGYLSMEEFQPLVDRVLGNETSYPVDEEIDSAGEIIVLKTHFEPFVLASMSKNKNPFGFMNSGNLKALRSWTEPVRELSSFGASHFAPFLPPPAGYSVLGAAYEIIPSNLNMFSGTLSSNRYFPPKVSNKEVILHRLLGLFHPRPFVRMRFAPQGAVATVRAENERWVDIVFRIHAEFQLNEPPQYPFWFTPAQFTGNIVLTRDASRVRHFHLYVPTNRSLNVDMEWLNGPGQENMEVDIGYIPRMELTSVAPSTPVLIYEEDGSYMDQREAELTEECFIFEPEIFLEEDYADIQWNSEISMEEAMRSLELKMYPFKTVPYYNFTEAFSRAEAENKLVHSILLWGALDDQSC
ncbi:SELENON [Branchiostoma lanceolatum]|uniref:SELENON protein n=1 Tax=Branchiostoma lanceolatum TaxID=7740 RepID=A0A8J9ZQ49_BRALA|nr:SELENON [Branchiostoma lanceolatum]